MSRGTKKGKAACRVFAQCNNGAAAHASRSSRVSLIVRYSLAGHNADDVVDFVVFKANGALIEARLHLLQ